MLEVMPQSGADERMAEVLISLYSTCPPGTGIQFHLFASPHLRDQLRRYANLRVEDLTRPTRPSTGDGRRATTTCSTASLASASATCCTGRRHR
jgi:hypothetical protein